MSHAIDNWKLYEANQRLVRVSELQDYILKKYTEFVQDGDARDDLRRSLFYLIQLIYREAQEPMVKNMCDMLDRVNYPLIKP